MRITVAEAAKLLGVSPQFVRLGLQRGELPIGSAVKMSSIYTYYISQHLLDEYLGTKKTALLAQDGSCRKATERTEI